MLELLQLTAGLETELADQGAPRRPVGLERVGLASCAVQREHQLRPRPLPRRGRCDELLELRHEVRRPSCRECRGEAVLGDAVAQLGERRRVGARKGLVGELRERGAADGRKRLVEQVERRGGIAVLDAATPVGREEAAAIDVQLTRLDAQHVAAGGRRQPVGPEQLSQPRDLDLHAVLRGRRRAVCPEEVDEAVPAHDRVRVQEQYRQQPALLRAFDAYHVPAPPDLERAQQPELEHRIVTNVTPFGPAVVERHVSRR